MYSFLFKCLLENVVVTINDPLRTGLLGDFFNIPVGPSVMSRLLLPPSREKIDAALLLDRSGSMPFKVTLDVSFETGSRRLPCSSSSSSSSSELCESRLNTSGFLVDSETKVVFFSEISFTVRLLLPLAGSVILCSGNTRRGLLGSDTVELGPVTRNRCTFNRNSTNKYWFRIRKTQALQTTRKNHQYRKHIL